MKPFNLKAALAGAPLMTRDGDPVKNFRVNNGRGSEAYPYRADVPGNSLSYTKKGRFFRDGTEDCDDLFMAEVKPGPDKFAAFKDLHRDVANRRPSRTSYLRVCKALDALEFSEEEKQRALHWLQYTDSFDNLYPQFQPKEKQS